MGRLITIELINFDGIEAAFDPEILRAQAEQIVGKVGKAALDEMRAGYEAQRDPDGTEWLALSPKYAEWKERTHPGKQKLHLEEALFGSLGWERDPDPAFAVIGAINSPPVYTGIQNRGGQTGRADIPRREFAGVPEAFFDNLKDACEVFFTVGEWPL